MITKTITTAPTTTSAVRSVAFLEARTPANLPRVWPGAGLEGGAKLDSSVAMTVNLSHGVSRPDRRLPGKTPKYPNEEKFAS
jgi:hypothetical protein